MGRFVTGGLPGVNLGRHERPYKGVAISKRLKKRVWKLLGAFSGLCLLPTILCWDRMPIFIALPLILLEMIVAISLVVIWIAE